MGWKISVVNKLYPDYRDMICGVDTGNSETSVRTTSPTAADNEIIIYGEENNLTKHDKEDLEATIKTIASTYGLDYLYNQTGDGHYQYRFLKTESA